MIKPSSDYPPQKAGRMVEYSGGMMDDNMVSGGYGEGEFFLLPLCF